MKPSTKKKESGTRSGASKSKAAGSAARSSPAETSAAGSEKPEGKRARKSQPVENVTPVSRETPLSSKRRRIPPQAKSGETKAAPAEGANGGTVRIRADIGFGNSLFIRGEGGPLSWDKGTPAENAGPDEWIWRAPANERVEFKVLINDETWSQGDNFSVDPGQERVCNPVF